MKLGAFIQCQCHLGPFEVEVACEFQMDEWIYIYISNECLLTQWYLCNCKVNLIFTLQCRNASPFHSELCGDVKALWVNDMWLLKTMGYLSVQQAGAQPTRDRPSTTSLGYILLVKCRWGSPLRSQRQTVILTESKQQLLTYFCSGVCSCQQSKLG